MGLGLLVNAWWRSFCDLARMLRRSWFCFEVKDHLVLKKGWKNWPTYRWVQRGCCLYTDLRQLTVKRFHLLISSLSLGKQLNCLLFRVKLLFLNSDIRQCQECPSRIAIKTCCSSLPPRKRWFRFGRRIPATSAKWNERFPPLCGDSEVHWAPAVGWVSTRGLVFTPGGWD